MAVIPPSHASLQTISKMGTFDVWSTASAPAGRQIVLINRALGPSKYKKVSEMSKGLELLAKTLKKDAANLPSVDADTKLQAYSNILGRVNNMCAKMVKQNCLRRFFMNFICNEEERLLKAFASVEKELYGKKYLSPFSRIFNPPSPIFGKNIQQSTDVNLNNSIKAVQKKYGELRNDLDHSSGDYWNDDNHVKAFADLMEECSKLSERFLRDELIHNLLTWSSAHYLKTKISKNYDFLDLLNSKDTYLSYAVLLIPQIYSLVRLGAKSYGNLKDNVKDDYVNKFDQIGTPHNRCRTFYNDYCKLFRKGCDQSPQLLGSFWEEITEKDVPGKDFAKNLNLFKEDLCLNNR